MKKLELRPGPSDEGERLDRFISRAGGVSRGEARRVLERGGVWVGGKRVKVASRPVRAGQSVLVVLEEAGRSAGPAAELAAERILFEDASLVAVDKPPFVAAQATLGSDEGNLLALVSAHLGGEAGLVHRLDLETSGVTVFGKTRSATRALAAAFREGTAHKRYLAIAFGELADEGRIETPISPDPHRKGRYLAVAGGRMPAATRYKVLGRKGRLCAVEAFPETGRTHQIRVHLASLGAPLVGDKLYGGPKAIETDAGPVQVERVLLHARELQLPHPKTGEPLRILAPVPAEIAWGLGLAGVGLAEA
ncbi:MAG: RluA family pseudouridine synthase [Myxococcales bacterium]